MAGQEAGCRCRPLAKPGELRCILCLATQSDRKIIRKMNDLSKASAADQMALEVGEEGEAQRIDNFLLRELKGVPKSHVYRVLRSGEVRVNSGRVKPDYRLKIGDRVRIPPVRMAEPKNRSPAPAARAADHVRRRRAPRGRQAQRRGRARRQRRQLRRHRVAARRRGRRPSSSSSPTASTATPPAC